MGWVQIIANILSLVTISLCLVLKIPQIYRLVKSGKASGLSLKGLLLELSSYTVSMMYNFTNHHAILTYLEYPILVIQEYFLIGLVMNAKHYKMSYIFLVLIFYIFATIAFACNILNKTILAFLLPLTIPVGATSKIMQLIEILSSKNAASVSLLTWFLSAFTNLTRVFTVYVDSANVNILLNMSISTILSTTVLCAAMYYQKLPSQTPKKID